MPAVIEVQHLHKSYGNTVAVDDVSLTVQRGEIFGNDPARGVVLREPERRRR